MRIAVTGATGYIGTYLIGLARTHNHYITAVSRRRPHSRPMDWIPWEMSAKTVALPPGTDVVVHLAAETTWSRDRNEETEVLAAEVLVAAARKVRAKFIFVSSQTARPHAPTSYGRIKWRIEEQVLAAGGWVVRPGLVYGASARGVFGTLVDIVGRVPILPAFLPAPQVQPIHVHDLAEGLLRIVEGEEASCRTYVLAGSQPVSFTRFLHEIARSRLRCHRMFLPIPASLFLGCSRVLDVLSLRRWGIERVQSLFDLSKMETVSDLNRLGLVLRPLNSGLHVSGSARKRRMLQEGLALLTYVLKTRPENAALRRYVRMIEQLRGGETLNLPNPLLRHPALLSLLGDSTWDNEAAKAEFAWRMDAATLLGEATPAGSVRFLGLGRQHGLFSRGQVLVKAATCELMWRSLSAVGVPLVRKMLARAKAAL